MKNFGKRMLTSLLLVVVLLTGTVSASAASIGSQTWEIVGNWSMKQKAVKQSSGGNFTIAIPGHYADWSPDATDYLEVFLYEDDGTYGDDYVKTWLVARSALNKSLTITNASDFVDGIDGKAEFYVKYRSNYTADPITVTYYD